MLLSGVRHNFEGLLIGKLVNAFLPIFFCFNLVCFYRSRLSFSTTGCDPTKQNIKAKINSLSLSSCVSDVRIDLLQKLGIASSRRP